MLLQIPSLQSSNNDPLSVYVHQSSWATASLKALRYQDRLDWIGILLPIFARTEPGKANFLPKPDLVQIKDRPLPDLFSHR